MQTALVVRVPDLTDSRRGVLHLHRTPTTRECSSASLPFLLPPPPPSSIESFRLSVLLSSITKILNAREKPRACILWTGERIIGEIKEEGNIDIYRVATERLNDKNPFIQRSFYNNLKCLNLILFLSNTLWRLNKDWFVIFFYFYTVLNFCYCCYNWNKIVICSAAFLN